MLAGMQAMKYLLHPGVLIRRMKDPVNGRVRTVRQYIRVSDFVTLFELEGKDYELYDGRKHAKLTGVTHLRAIDTTRAVSNKAVEAPRGSNKKGFFGE